MRIARIQKLEVLVQEAAEQIKLLLDENRKLKREVSLLQERNENLESRLRQLGSVHSKHQRLKAQLERLAHKLDKAVDLVP